jgi:predicted RNA-binding protein with PIN domain
MKQYFIDGNNVIHKSSFLKQKFSQSPEIACNSLLAMIDTAFDKYSSYRFKVFFDGFNTGIVSPSHRIQTKNSGAKTADENLKKSISAIKSPANKIVVTSDTEVHNFARVHGVAVITSEEFLRQISGGSPARKSKSKKNQKNEKPSASGKKEIREFLELFTRGENTG